MARKGDKRCSTEELAARLREVEEAMARRVPKLQMEAAFSKKWDCSERTIRRYTSAIRARWREEATSEDRHERRDAMRASLNVIFGKSMMRTTIVKDADGNPILDSNGRPLTIDNPDTRSAIQAAKTLIQLDALDDPALLRVQVQADVTHGVTDAGRAALEAFLTGRGAKP